MWKALVYNNEIYDNFVINEDGQIKNVKSNNIYKVYINKCGYAVVTLPMGKRGKVKVIRLHKAIAETFIPNPNNYTVVHHKDENRANYSLDNLEWTTSRLNTLYSLEERSKISSFFNNRKLTKDDVEFIRANNFRISRRQLAKMFNVSRPTIENVINGTHYSNNIW